MPTFYLTLVINAVYFVFSLMERDLSCMNLRFLPFFFCNHNELSLYQAFFCSFTIGKHNKLTCLQEQNYFSELSRREHNMI